MNDMWFGCRRGLRRSNSREAQKRGTSGRIRSFGSGPEADWRGFPFFSLSASRYFDDKETLCLYLPLGTIVMTAPKVLDFYAGVCAHIRAQVKTRTPLKASSWRHKK
jgi:hypothetical protein